LQEPVTPHPSHNWLPLAAGLAGVSGIVALVAIMFLLNAARSTPPAPAATAANAVPTVAGPNSALAVGTATPPAAVLSLAPTALPTPNPAGPTSTPVRSEPTTSSAVVSAAATPTGLPSATSTPSGADLIAQVSRAIATLHSAQIEATIAY